MRKVNRDLLRLNKQVVVASKFAREPVGSNAWNTFVLSIEHLYIVGKLESEPAFHAEKTSCYQLQQQTKVHVLALVTQTTLVTCTNSTQ